MLNVKLTNKLFKKIFTKYQFNKTKKLQKWSLKKKMTSFFKTKKINII